MLKTFAVKIMSVELDENGFKKSVIVSLGEGLDWQTAKELKKENKGSWVHRENKKF